MTTIRLIPGAWRLHMTIILVILAMNALPGAEPQIPGAGTFVLAFPAADAPALHRTLYGWPATAAGPRTGYGSDRAEPEFRRGSALSAWLEIEVETVPFVMPAAPLRVNVDVLLGVAAMDHGAFLMAEIRDADGRIIKGFQRGRCVVTDVDALDHVLRWGDATSQSLAGQTVRLVLLMRDARLWSVHDRALAPERLDRLDLAIARSQLKAWDTATVQLTGRTAAGMIIGLDHLPVRLESDHPALTTRLGKRNAETGSVTVATTLTAPAQAEVHASVIVAGRTIRSPALVVALTPSPVMKGDDAFKMLFCRPRDTLEVRGTIDFRPGTITHYAETKGLPTTTKAMTLFNRRIGDEWHVWGSSRTPGGIFHATTSDGITYRTEPVISDMKPNHFMDMTWSPELGRYFAFERQLGQPYCWLAHTSTDGLTFSKQGIIFEDFDSLEVTWDPRTHQFIAMQLTMQQLPARRRHRDNLHASPKKNRARRIFARRTSTDGVRWSAGNVDLVDPKTWLSEPHHAIVPDAADPPGLECYWLNIFFYGDRWFGLFMTVAPAPAEFLAVHPYDKPPSLHGPHARVEWVVSEDLLQWERPFRHVNATSDWRIYFGHAPMVMHDRLLFLACNQIYNLPPDQAAADGQVNEIYSLPRDRIVAAAGKDGTSFLTKPFTMPSTALHLNAIGDVQIEMCDADGVPIPDFTGDRCDLRGLDALHHPLAWAGRDSSVLAGRTVRIRFKLIDAQIFSIHTWL